MKDIMGSRTKLKTLIILSPLLCILIVGLCFALPFYPQLGEWIVFSTGLLIVFLVSIAFRLYSFRSHTVSFMEFINTRPLFIKYLLLDRRNERG